MINSDDKDNDKQNTSDDTSDKSSDEGNNDKDDYYSDINEKSEGINIFGKLEECPKSSDNRLYLNSFTIMVCFW